MIENKYANLESLRAFKDNLNQTFAPLIHEHSWSNLLDKPFGETAEASTKTWHWTLNNSNGWMGGTDLEFVTLVMEHYADAQVSLGDNENYYIDENYSIRDKTNNIQHLYIHFFTDDNGDYTGAYRVGEDGAGWGTCTITLPCTIEHIQTIDEKYIPDTIARVSDIVQADWAETYDDSVAYIRNKPFGDFYTIKRMGDETITVIGKYTTFTLVSNDVLEYEELSGVALYSGASGSFPSLTRFSDNAYGTYSGILVITQDDTTCSQVSNNPFPQAGVYLGSSTEYAVLQVKKIPEKYIPSKYETADSVQAKIDIATETLASKEYVDESMSVTKIDTQLTAAEIMALPDGMYYFTDNGRFSIYLYDSWSQDESTYVTDVTICGLCKFDEYEIFSYDNGSSYYKCDPRVYDGQERVCSAVEYAAPMHYSYGGMYQLDTRQTVNVRLRQYKDGTIEYENNNNYIEYLRAFGWGISDMLTQCTIHTNNSNQDFELYEVEKLVGDDEYLYGIKYVGYKDNYRYDVVCELNGITVNKTEIVTKEYVDNAGKVGSLSDLGITATAAELNKMDGVIVSTSEINQLDGVTSNIQVQLDEKIPTTRTVNGKALSANITLSASDVGAEPSGTISTHNTNTSAHNDIRDLITGLTTRLNTLADSDDTTLDQMSEIVAYIKSNKELIESITTSKVNVADIINNLTTNVSNKPLSAAQGVVLKGLIDALQASINGKVDTSVLANYYSKTEFDNLELITVEDIDAICGATIQIATLGVTF